MHSSDTPRLDGPPADLPGLSPVRPLADLPARPLARWRTLAEATVSRPGTARAIVFGWLIGVFVFTLRLTGAWIVTRRLATRAIRPVADEISTRAQQIAERLALARPVRLYESAAVAAPMIVGWIRPIVLMPVASLAGLSIAQVDALIAHELAHLRRHDPIVNLLQSVAETLLFYHPAVWWVSRGIRQDREHCCDDLAISVTGDRLTYATALADLASQTAGRPLALAAGGGSLVDRIARVLGEPDRRSWTPAVGAVVLLSAVAVAALAPLVASQSPPHVGRTDLQSAGSREFAVSLPSANSGVHRHEPARLPYATPNVAQVPPAPAATASGGVIEGLVTAAGGTPLANVAVRLLEQRVVNGRAYLLPIAAGRPVIDGSAKPGVDLEKTDRDGRFSFKQVLKGTYYVLAAPEPFGLTSYRPSGVGNFTALGNQLSALAAELGPTGFAPTYFPDGYRASDARPIQLGDGEIVRNVAIALRPVQTGTVTARLIALPGSPGRSGLLTAVAQLYPAPAGEVQPAVKVAKLSSSASFIFENVPAGEYMLSIDPHRRVIVKPGETTEITALSSGTVSARGRLLFEGAAARPPMTDVWFLFEPVDDLAPTWRSGTQERLGYLKQPYHANVSADGTFDAWVIGSANVVRLNIPVPGWALERVWLMGRDITDSPIDFPPNVEGLEVVLTSRLGSAAVTVTDGGRLSPERGIAIFAEDRALNQFRSRYIHVDRADTEGRRTFADLLPGRYLAVALPDAPREGLQTIDPAWLESMRPRATPFTVSEGARTTISVPVLR